MPIAGVCFCASSCGTCGFPRRVLPQVTLRGSRNLSGSFWLSCSCRGAVSVGFAVSFVPRLFSALSRALPTAPAVLRGSPYRWLSFGVSASFLATSACCAGGVGWASALPLCSQCFSCAGWLADDRWVLHPVTGFSRRGCDCSLYSSVVVPYGSPSL